MANIYVLLLVIALSVCSAFAQDKVDHTGTWTLDKTASKLDERARIESMTMTVAQTDKELKITTATKRSPAPEGMGGGRPGGGRGMGGGFGGGDGVVTYSLDGKETTMNQETQMGSVPVALKAKSENGKLKLTQTRTISGQMGEITITTKETWAVSADGKTLTVEREMSTPRGTNSSTLVFSKN